MGVNHSGDIGIQASLSGSLDTCVWGISAIHVLETWVEFEQRKTIQRLTFQWNVRAESPSQLRSETSSQFMWLGIIREDNTAGLEEILDILHRTHSWKIPKPQETWNYRTFGLWDLAQQQWPDLQLSLPIPIPPGPPKWPSGPGTTIF